MEPVRGEIAMSYFFLLEERWWREEGMMCLPRCTLFLSIVSLAILVEE